MKLQMCENFIGRRKLTDVANEEHLYKIILVRSSPSRWSYHPLSSIRSCTYLYECDFNQRCIALKIRPCNLKILKVTFINKVTYKCGIIFFFINLHNEINSLINPF